MVQVWHIEKTNTGRKRDHNEDFVGSFAPINPSELEASGRLYIVADGVGGASKGEKASRYAVEKLLHEYYRRTDLLPEERLKQVIQQIGNEIYSFAEESSTFMRMATTIVVAVVLEDQLILAHVGDSRAYLIRNGITTQLTTDHSWVEEMVRSGVMTKDEARKSRNRNRITRSLGGERNVKVDVNRYQLEVGDRILLCSDGFSQYVTQEQISQLAVEGDLEEIASRMIDFANRSGGSDNISVSLLEIYPDSYQTPTVRTASVPTAPNPLEDRPTDPGVEFTKAPFYKQSWFFFVLGFVVVFIVGLLMGTSLLNRQPEEISTTDGVMVSVLTTPTETYEPVIETEVVFVDATQTVEAIMHQVEETNAAQQQATETITPEPIVIDNPAGAAICRYHLTQQNREDYPSNDGQQVDLLSLMYYGLGNQAYDTPEKFENYSQNIQCADVQDNLQCAYEVGSFTAQIDWVLDFPDVQSVNCVNAGGIAVSNE